MSRPIGSRNGAVKVGNDLEHGLAESPGWIAFALDDGVVYHTYSRMAPDHDFVVPYYHQLLDRTPKGRATSSERGATTSTKTLRRHVTSRIAPWPDPVEEIIDGQR